MQRFIFGLCVMVLGLGVALAGCAEREEAGRISGEISMRATTGAAGVRAGDGWRVVFREPEEEEGLKLVLVEGEGDGWVLEWDLGELQPGREVWISTTRKAEMRGEEVEGMRAWAVCERGYVTAYGLKEEVEAGELRLGFEKIRSPRFEKSGAVLTRQEGVMELEKAGGEKAEGRGYAWLVEDGGVVGENGDARKTYEWGWLVTWEPVTGADGKVRVGEPRIVWMERAGGEKREMPEEMSWSVMAFDRGTQARGRDGVEQEFTVYVLRVAVPMKEQIVCFQAIFGLSSEGAVYYQRSGGREATAMFLKSPFVKGLWRTGGAKLHGGGHVRVMR